MVMSEVYKQVIWIHYFLYSISKESVYNRTLIIIYKNNQGTIKLVDNPVNHLKIKHIAVHYHAIQEHIINSKI